MVDGTLFPCLDWRDRRDPWSVKHGRAGMNVKILVRLNGGFMWASGPYPGSMHDVAAPGAFRTARRNRPLRMDRRQGIRRKGNDHPAQEAPNGELDEKAKEANRSVNRIRRAGRAHHRPHQVLENPPHPLQETPAHIRADHHRGTHTLFLQDHPLNNLPDTTPERNLV